MFDLLYKPLQVKIYHTLYELFVMSGFDCNCNRPAGITTTTTLFIHTRKKLASHCSKEKQQVGLKVFEEPFCQFSPLFAIFLYPMTLLVYDSGSQPF